MKRFKVDDSETVQQMRSIKFFLTEAPKNFRHHMHKKIDNVWQIYMEGFVVFYTKSTYAGPLHCHSLPCPLRDSLLNK